VIQKPGACRTFSWPLGVVVAIVLLRVVTGWHFYREGTKKLAYNASTGELSVAFTAEPFLRLAVGPFADRIKGDLPDFHQWETLLVVPRSASEAAEFSEERKKWDGEYARRVKAATDKEETPPVEFPPVGPIAEWAKQIDTDWKRMVAVFNELPGLTDEQQAAAMDALHHRRQQLADYLGAEEPAIAEWQHELSRLKAWEDGADAESLPFQAARIAEKKTETAATAAAWVAQVRELEAGLREDLRAVLTPEQSLNDEFVEQTYDTIADPKERELHRLNVAVTCLLIGVGACLMLGLFTRLAALGGIAFLTMVVAAQPPWVAGAEPTYYQLVEIAGLLVLLSAGAGRWLGLDFILRALFRRCCGRTGTVKS
jgi:uncharacterized membrane protein YphA (DoxX/SURF4 family)